MKGLIVEDVSDTRRWLAKLLSQAFTRIDIKTCQTLAQAKSVIKKHEFSIVLLDIGLPDGCGTDLVPLIKKTNPNCYIVMATIFDDESHLFAALKAGADGYLLKDAPDEVIINKLQGILSGDPPLSPSIARKMLRHFSLLPPHAKRFEKCKLSPREQEVLTMIAKGLGRREIAELLGLSSNTVARYIKDVYYKLNVSSRAEATIEACRMGLVNINNSY